MSGELDGRAALILGANGGIGRSIAFALGTAGARLILASRNTDALDGLRAELAAAGITSRSIPTDAASDQSVRTLVEQAASAGMDIAVNNVGAAHQPAKLGLLSIDTADRVLSVMLRGTLVAMKYELAAMPAGGSLVNMVSTAGLGGAPGMSAYAAAKHGIVGLTRTAALDYSDQGIRVNAVAPSAIDSGPNTTQPEEVRRRIGSFLPLGRLGTPDEVAAAVRWLASPASSFTTGSVLTVDGGKGARGA